MSELTDMLQTFMSLLLFFLDRDTDVSLSRLVAEHSAALCWKQAGIEFDEILSFDAFCEWFASSDGQAVLPWLSVLLSD